MSGRRLKRISGCERVKGYQSEASFHLLVSLNYEQFAFIIKITKTKLGFESRRRIEKSHAGLTHPKKHSL